MPTQIHIEEKQLHKRLPRINQTKRFALLDLTINDSVADIVTYLEKVRDANVVM